MRTQCEMVGFYVNEQVTSWGLEHRTRQRLKYRLSVVIDFARNQAQNGAYVSVFLNYWTRDGIGP